MSLGRNQSRSDADRPEKPGKMRCLLDLCFAGALVLCAISVGAILLETPRYGPILKISLLLALVLTIALLEISLALRKRKSELGTRAWIYFGVVVVAQFAASFVIYPAS